ncbi:MAG TPA: tRNA (guanosine(46)-N7)-methyltransferase TrmB [Spirochaetia bacterium]|nr:tRNA (guanosine(46)-N7)-methyltransferase TrmB [Spirochaetia bacterium]
MENTNKQIDPSGHIKTYALRTGRMTDAQKKAYHTLYSRYGITEADSGIVSSEKLFSNSKPLIIEIGFGMGQATSEIAQKRPDYNFLGIEVHTPGVGKLLILIEELKLDNLKVFHGDALPFLANHIADNSLAGFHIFFPDPWPKKRHHKRRIINKENLAFFTRKLKPEGYIYFITDWEEYAESAKAIFDAEPGLYNSSLHESGWAERQDWRPVTKFELRAKQEGRSIRELFYRKRDTKPSSET